MGNEDSPYNCKELTPQLITDKDINKWYDAIETSTLQHAQQQRAVLVICKYIRQVHNLEERLKKRYANDKIFTYTGKNKFKKDRVYPGEIIIATNIAGRGTDLTPSEMVEQHGGMHVCVTFLPESYRVELQNVGRTARKGSRGTAQLILHQPSATSIEDLRQQRDTREAEALQQAIDEVKRMTFKDELFQEFCELENKLLPTLDGFTRLRHSELLEEAWKGYAQEALPYEEVKKLYTQRMDKCVQDTLDAIPRDQWSRLSYEEKQAQKEKILQEVRSNCPFSTFQNEYELGKRREIIQEIQTALGTEGLHADVVTAFQEGRKYVPENGDLAVQYAWGPYERKAVEERFGLWFHQHMPQAQAPIDFDGVRTAFKTFLQEIQDDAEADNLIQNPYFFVQKGNALLGSGDSSEAVEAYDRAIELDPEFSLHAHYNKALALLSPEKNKEDHEDVIAALFEAKVIIKQYRERLFTFQTLIGHAQPPKPLTAQHLQHYLDVLGQQEKFIDSATGVLEQAQSNKSDVKITQRVEVNTLFDKDQEAEQGNREQALAELYEDGLLYFFTIEENPPRPWLSICTVALIGLVQIAAATFAAVATAGVLTTKLLQSGISDLVTAISSAISGKFSWKDWGIAKAINIGISIISTAFSDGWSALKENCKAVVDNVKEGFKSITDNVLHTKEALIEQFKTVAGEVGKGVGIEISAMMLQKGVEEMTSEALKEKITQAVSQDIMQCILNNDLIKKAMAHDVAKGRDYWSQILIKEALAMLNEKDSVWYTLLKGIVQGTALQKLNKHIEGLCGENTSKAAILTNLMSIGLPMISGVLTDIHGFTDNFLTNFQRRIEQKYGQELNRLETPQKTAQTSQKASEDDVVDNAEQEFMHVIDAQEPIDEDDLQLHDRYNGQAFSTQAKVVTKQVTIDPNANPEERARAMGELLTDNISGQLLGKIHQHVTFPLTNKAASALINTMTAGITKNLQAHREKAILASKAGIHENKHANEPAGETTHDQTPDRVDTASEGPNTMPQNPEADNNRPQDDEQASYPEGDITKLGAASKILGRAIQIRAKGKDQGYIGTKNKVNGVIELEYISNPNPTKNNNGHWVVRVNGEIIDTAGDNSGLCMFNALVAGTPEPVKQKRGISSGKDLYHKVEAHRQAHPTYALQSDIHYQTLLHHNPDALMRGAGMQTVEMIYAQHALQGTEPDWAAMGKRDLGFTVGLLQSLVKQAKDTVEGVGVLVDGVLIHLPIALVQGIATLVQDPGGSVENIGENVGDIIATIKALPEYIEHAPAEVKAYFDKINALEDPYEQGEALGKLMGNVLPTAVVAGSLGKGRKAAKEFKKVGRVGKGVSKGVGRADKEVFSFTGTALNPNRSLPVSILKDAIKNSKGLPDPQGTKALMHYAQITRNRKTYNLEVLYDQATNTIMHFKYDTKALGPLKAIPKAK